MRCINCQYDLTQLTEHRCPECGRDFDPADSATYYDRQSHIDDMMRRSRIPIYISLAAPLAVFVFAFRLLLFPSQSDSPVDYFLILVPISLMASIVILLGLFVEAWPVRRVLFARLFACLAAVVILRLVSYLIGMLAINVAF